MISSWYGEGVIDKIFIPRKEIFVDLQVEIPHWCHPGENDFCE